jgi:hypothetical protein|tara:strand:+ start:3180 stop:3467 length:288 start_codon:yes stop_codon:yes gene_type:complete
MNDENWEGRDMGFNHTAWVDSKGNDKEHNQFFMQFEDSGMSVSIASGANGSCEVAQLDSVSGDFLSVSPYCSPEMVVTICRMTELGMVMNVDTMS